jgi:alpha-beta hydrolase superfamily lysophospholipase
MRSRSIVTRIGTVMAVLAVAIAGLVGSPSLASGQTSNPFQRGPNPTQSSIEASRGAFAVSSTTVSSWSARGFGGGTIYYPNDTSQGRFGVVAISPGYTASQSSIQWLGPRLASQGFVVITIDTNSRFDQPASRGGQLLAALDYVVNSSSSTVRARVDGSRQAAMGHSMGGGGALEAASDRRTLEAIIPMQPWNLDKTWSEVQTPALIIGAENDSVASVSSHSIPFYNSLGGEKAYLELDGASHFVANTTDVTTAAYSISWLKRHVDNDTRYNQFLCGPNHVADIDISDWRSTCPF